MPCRMAGHLYFRQTEKMKKADSKFKCFYVKKLI